MTRDENSVEDSEDEDNGANNKPGKVDEKDDVSEVDEREGNRVYLLTPGKSPQAAPAPKHFCVFGSEYVHMDVEPLYLYYKTDWASASGDRARFYRLPNDKV